MYVFKFFEFLKILDFILDDKFLSIINLTGENFSNPSSLQFNNGLSLFRVFLEIKIP